MQHLTTNKIRQQSTHGMHLDLCPKEFILREKLQKSMILRTSQYHTIGEEHSNANFIWINSIRKSYGFHYKHSEQRLNKFIKPSIVLPPKLPTTATWPMDLQALHLITFIVTYWVVYNTNVLRIIQFIIHFYESLEKIKSGEFQPSN